MDKAVMIGKKAEQDKSGNWCFDFSDAYRHLDNNKSVARVGWHGKGLLKITMQRPVKNSKMGTSYLYITMPDGTNIPWLPSQTDLSRVDWYIVE